MKWDVCPGCQFKFSKRPAANLPCLNWGRNIFPFISLFGTVWKLFERLSNELLVPMWLLKCRNFSISPGTLLLVPFVFFAISFLFRILFLSNNSMLWLMVYQMGFSLSMMYRILGKSSCLAKTICYDLGLTGRFAGNVCQNLSLAIWANVGNVQAHWERKERWQRSRRVRRFWLSTSYIYILTSQINSFFFNC